jgi:hypothetical protein
LKLIGAVSRHGDARHRFLREARAACAVRHPNVVQVHDVLELDDGSPVMVMDLLDGESLGARLRRSGKLPLAEAARITLQVVSAVGTAHAAGIVHRDLKPDNVFLVLRADGATEVKVLDFGIAKLTAVEGDAAQTAGLTATGALLGTPHYMAPEQAFGERDVDHRADVWAIGIMLNEYLSGVLPTRAENVGQILKIVTTGAIRPLEELEPSLPREITALVGRMLARERDARPGDLGEVKAVLGRHTDVSVPSFGGPVAPRERSKRGVVLAVAATAIAASVAAAVLWGRGESPVTAPVASQDAACRSPADCVSGRCYEDACRPWSESWGDSELDTTTAVSFAPDGDVYAAGYFAGYLDRRRRRPLPRRRASWQRTGDDVPLAIDAFVVE